MLRSGFSGSQSQAGVGGSGGSWSARLSPWGILDTVKGWTGVGDQEQLGGSQVVLDGGHWWDWHEGLAASKYGELGQEQGGG